MSATRQILHRRAVEHVVVGADALDSAQRPRPEARAGAVGDAEVHRHADHGDLQIAEIRIVVVDLHVRRGEEGRHARIGRDARPALGENLVGHPPELRVEQLAAMALAIFAAQALPVCRPRNP